MVVCGFGLGCLEELITDGCPDISNKYTYFAQVKNDDMLLLAAYSFDVELTASV